MMHHPLIHTVKWAIYRLINRISHVAWLALGLIVLAAFIVCLINYPLIRSLQTLKLQSSLASRLPALTSQSDSLGLYVKQFPALTERASKVDDLMALVAQHQLQLDEVSYKTEANINEPLNINEPFSRYVLTFSVFASYPQIHQLLNDILTQMPFVAIDTLQLNRESVLDETVEARIQLVFYFAKAAI